MLRRTGTMCLTVVLCLLLTVIRAGAANASTVDAATSPDDVRLAFVDPAGAQTSEPYFDVSGAYPGMAPQASTVTLSNPGSLALSYDLAVVVTSAPEGPQLGDVLVATVSRDGVVRYRGPLSELTVTGTAPIHPRASSAYDMSITWPDGGDADNQYQGVSLTFDIIARSWETPISSP